MKTVFVPLDGSERAEAALGAAVPLATRLGAELVLLSARWPDVEHRHDPELSRRAGELLGSAGSDLAGARSRSRRCHRARGKRARCGRVHGHSWTRCRAAGRARKRRRGGRSYECHAAHAGGAAIRIHVEARRDSDGARRARRFGPVTRRRARRRRSGSGDTGTRARCRGAAAERRRRPWRGPRRPPVELLEEVVGRARGQRRCR